MMDVNQFNQRAWDAQVESGNQWTIPVSTEEVQAARQGNWDIILTPTKPVPKDWFPELKGLSVLCLGSGGGQQGPLLAAAGAEVTVFDQSPKQLAQDRLVAERDNLAIRTVQGDMADLGAFDSAVFDLIIHPVSNCFVADVRPVWREVQRVLKPGGQLFSGLVNPLIYIFEQEGFEKGLFKIVNKIPYSDLKSLNAEKLKEYEEKHYPLEFGHSLDDLIAGQIGAGLVITGFYEDTWEMHAISKYIATFFVTRARKK